MADDRLPPDRIPAGAQVVWQHETRKVQNRHRWIYLARVGDAMGTFPTDKGQWRRLGVREAARILLITVLATRPDFDAKLVGLDENAAWGHGRLVGDEGFGREWADGSFANWDDGTRRNGLWMDLAAVAWKVMQNHPDRGRAPAAAPAPALVGVERIHQLPIPDAFKPALVETDRFVLAQPERFATAVSGIDVDLAARAMPDADGTSYPPVFWLRT